MWIHLNGDYKTPVYRQIGDTIKHQVAVGELAQGERLPTVRQLAQDLGVDRNTVVRAYRLLDREGVISLQHGRGTFVKTPSQHPHLARHRREHLDLLMGEGIARALSLGYAPDEIRQTFARRLREWQRAREQVRPRGSGVHSKKAHRRAKE